MLAKKRVLAEIIPTVVRNANACVAFAGELADCPTQLNLIGIFYGVCICQYFKYERNTARKSATGELK